MNFDDDPDFIGEQMERNGDSGLVWDLVWIAILGGIVYLFITYLR